MFGERGRAVRIRYGIGLDSTIVIQGLGRNRSGTLEGSVRVLYILELLHKGVPAGYEVFEQELCQNSPRMVQPQGVSLHSPLQTP